MFLSNTEVSGQKSIISFSRSSSLLLFCHMETNYDTIVLFLPHWIFMGFDTCKNICHSFCFWTHFIFLWLGTSLYLPFSLLRCLFCLQTTTCNWRCFPLSQPSAVRTHFWDILLAPFAIHRFQNIRLGSHPIFNTMQSTRLFCHYPTFSSFKSL